MGDSVPRVVQTSQDVAIAGLVAAAAAADAAEPAVDAVDAASAEPAVGLVVARAAALDVAVITSETAVKID